MILADEPLSVQSLLPHDNLLATHDAIMKTTLKRPFRSTRRLPAAKSVKTAASLNTPCRQLPEFCVRMLANKATHARQKARILARLPRSPELQQRIVAVLRGLPDDELLQVLDGLCHSPPGNRYARQLGLRALVGHARFAELATQDQPRLTRLLRDLLGRRTWTAVRRQLRTPSEEGDRILHRGVLRFAADPETARDVLSFLAGIGNEAPQSVQRLVLILRWLQRANHSAIH
jgi:hypothetical protein